MSISNFPAALQPIIQQGFLEREFEQALRSRIGYRACADREDFAVGIGETLTKTRAGLKPAVTTPLAANTNTNLDNGLTPGSWNVEQFTLTLNHYAATMDLNMVTSRVGIASQFLQNAYVNGEQAAQRVFRRQYAGDHDAGQRRADNCCGRRARVSDGVREWRAAACELRQSARRDGRRGYLYADRRGAGCE